MNTSNSLEVTQHIAKKYNLLPDKRNVKISHREIFRIQRPYDDYKME